jgi:hypothetical protein
MEVQDLPDNEGPKQDPGGSQGISSRSKSGRSGIPIAGKLMIPDLTPEVLKTQSRRQHYPTRRSATIQRISASTYNSYRGNLVDQRTAMHVVLAQDKIPDLRFGPVKQVTGLSLEHGVLVGDVDELKVVLALGVTDDRQIGIALFAVFTDYKGVILVVLLQELLGIVVRVNVDLSQGVVYRLLLVASGQSLLQEGQEKLEAVARLDLSNKLINGDGRGCDRGQEALDDALVTIYIEQTANDLRGPGRIDTLNVDLDGLELLFLVQVQNQVMDEVETIADDDERQLLGKIGFL